MSYLDHDDFGYDRGYESDSRPNLSNSSQTNFAPEANQTPYMMGPPGTHRSTGPTFPWSFPTDLGTGSGGTDRGTSLPEVSPEWLRDLGLGDGTEASPPEAESTAPVDGAAPTEEAAPTAPATEPESTPEDRAAEAAHGLAATEGRRTRTASAVDDSAPTYGPEELSARSHVERFGLDPDSFFEVVTPPEGGRSRSAFFTEISGMSEADLGRRYGETNARQWLDRYRSEDVPVDVAIRDLEARGIVEHWPEETLPTEWPRRTSDIPLTVGGVSSDEVRDSHRDLESLELGSDATRSVREHTARLEMVDRWSDAMVTDHAWTEDQARGVLANLPSSLDLNGLAHTLYNVPADTTVDLDHALPESASARVPSYNGEEVTPDHMVDYEGEPEPLARATMDYALAHAPVPPPPAATSPASSVAGDSTTLPDEVPADYATIFHSAHAEFMGTHGETPAVPVSGDSTVSAHEAPPAAPVEIREPSEAERTALSAEHDRMERIGFSEDEITEYQRQNPNRDADEIGGSFGRVENGEFIEVPESEREGILSRTHEEMRTHLFGEAATAIRRRDPSISLENAELMGEQLYEEHEADSLGSMIAARSAVEGDIGSEDLDALYSRTALDELADFETAARGALPTHSGRGGFYANTDAGGHNLQLFAVHAGGEDAIHDPSAIHRLAADEHLATRLDEFRTGAGRSESASRTALEGELGSSGADLESRIRGISGLRGTALRSALVNAATTEYTAGIEDSREERRHGWEAEEQERTRTFQREERVAGEATAFAMERVRHQMQLDQMVQQSGLQMFSQMFNTSFETMMRTTSEMLGRSQEAMYHEVQAGEQLQSTIITSMYPPQRMA